MDNDANIENKSKYSFPSLASTIQDPWLFLRSITCSIPSASICLAIVLCTFVGVIDILSPKIMKDRK